MTSLSRVIPTVILLTLCCVTLTLAFDGLWFGSLPEVVETTPFEVEMKTSRVGGNRNVKQRLRPPSTNNNASSSSSVRSTRQRVTSIKRRVNASAPVTSTVSGGQVKNVTQTRKNQQAATPSVEAKMEEVTYWETGGATGSETNANNSSEDGVSVSVKEHDRSPHPAAFSGVAGGWFGRFKNSGESHSEPVSVAGYQSGEESAIKGSEPEATVQIKEHDEPRGGAGAHFSFTSSGSDDESALWFGGSDGDDSGHNSKTEIPSSSSGGGGGGGGGGWFGLDDWAPLSLEANAGHRQQRRLNYRQTSEEGKDGDIITAPPQSSRDTFTFVVNSNLGGGGDGRSSKGTNVPSKDTTKDDVIITAEPSVVEDGWFDEETTTTTTSTSSSTTTTTTQPTTTTTVKPDVRNQSYILGVSKMSSINEQHSIVDSIVDAEEEEAVSNVSENDLTTPITSTSVSVTVSRSDPVTVTSTTEEQSITSTISVIDFEPIVESDDNLTTETPSTTTTTTQSTILEEIDTVTDDRQSPTVSREGREFETSFVGVNSNDDQDKTGSNMTKAPVMTSAAVPKVIKNGPLASNSMVNRESRDNTAYIIVGSCCAVSLVCLVIVVAILRYRKTIRRRRRHNPFHHYPMDRDPRFCHFETNPSWNAPTTAAFVQGHKGSHHHHQHFNAPPPPSTAIINQKSRNLWFIGHKRSSPYSLCEQPGYSAEPHVQDGGHVTSSPPLSASPSSQRRSGCSNSHSSGS